MRLKNLHVQQLDPRSRSDRSRLVRFPFKLYKKDRYWVPPLIGDRKKFLDPVHNPSFEYLKVAYFIAEAVVIPEAQAKNGLISGMEQDVGTIAAIVNPRHNDVHGDSVGFFGLFDVINSHEVADALFDVAAAWLSEQGCSVMRGPITFTVNDEIGLLVDGFDDSPRVLMPYNLPYYPELVEAYGFESAMDLYAYAFDMQGLYGGTPEGLPPKLVRVVNRLKERSSLVVRTIDVKQWDAEVARIKDVYRKAWQANWGAVPVTDAEIDHIAAQLKQILDPDLVHLAELDGQTVGISLMVPDANFVLKKMGGHLFPFGVIQALRYQNKIPWTRELIMGVLPDHRHRGVDAVLVYESAVAALRKGYNWVEGSWILANNVEMNRLMETFGARIYKTYRVYDKEL